MKDYTNNDLIETHNRKNWKGGAIITWEVLDPTRKTPSFAPLPVTQRSEWRFSHLV